MTTATAPPPLAGFTVGVTAARRADELGAMLERRGATVRHAPALRIVPLADDTQLLAATRELIERPPHITVATTGIGFRGWVEAADAWGLAQDLTKAFGEADILARGPKARGAIRAAGLRERWSPESESSSEVLEYLIEAGDLDGKRIAVQLHGEPLPDMVETLAMAGAEVIEVPVYRWVLPEDTAPLRRLIDAVAAASVDSVAFTSAPAATSFLRAAAEQGRDDAVRAALA
ncbi:MAG TPA: uroporphyrinogen-III synthase, partial [Pseudonocardia sp.]|nr:uroporphyrinogen-III synthase [Pseudonocardia sp.]